MLLVGSAVGVRRWSSGVFDASHGGRCVAVVVLVGIIVIEMVVVVKSVVAVSRFRSLSGCGTAVFRL